MIRINFDSPPYLKFITRRTLNMPQEKPSQLHPSWLAVIGNELEKLYIQALRHFLKEEKAAGKVIFPPSPLIFNAFNHTPF